VTDDTTGGTATTGSAGPAGVDVAGHACTTGAATPANAALAALAAGTAASGDRSRSTAGPTSATVTAPGSDTTGRAGAVRTGAAGESSTAIAAQSACAADARNGRTSGPARAADAAGHTGRRRGEPVPTVAPGAAGGGVIAGAARGTVGAAGPAGSCRAQCAPDARRADGPADTAGRPVRCINCARRPGAGDAARTGRTSGSAVSTATVAATDNVLTALLLNSPRASSHVRGLPLSAISVFIETFI
jgi:hypothetical protein